MCVRCVWGVAVCVRLCVCVDVCVCRVACSKVRIVMSDFGVWGCFANLDFIMHCVSVPLLLWSHSPHCSVGSKMEACRRSWLGSFGVTLPVPV